MTFADWLRESNVVTEDPPVRCEQCGIWTVDPHEPHDRGCTNQYEASGFGCQCDHVVCAGCCWECHA